MLIHAGIEESFLFGGKKQYLASTFCSIFILCFFLICGRHFINVSQKCLTIHWRKACLPMTFYGTLLCKAFSFLTIVNTF